MTGEWTVAAALAAGFFGSAHCLGMCGGIAGALGLGAEGPPGRRLAIVLLYNLGRVASYAFAGAAVGAAAGWLGDGLALPGWAAALRILTGALLVAIGLQLAFGWSGLKRIEALGLPLWRRLAPRVGALLPVRKPADAALLGMLWGWLPCGLVYTMLLAALLSGDAVSGASLMAAFGLGTVPAMAGVAAAGNSLAPLVRRQSLRAAAGVFVAILGVWTALVPMVGPHAGHGQGTGHADHDGANAEHHHHAGDPPAGQEPP